MRIKKCYGRAISIWVTRHQKRYYCKGGVWGCGMWITFFFPFPLKTKASVLKLHKGGLSAVCNPEIVTKESLGNQVLRNSGGKGFSKWLCEGLSSPSTLRHTYVLGGLAGPSQLRILTCFCPPHFHTMLLRSVTQSQRGVLGSELLNVLLLAIRWQCVVLICFTKSFY